MLEIGGIGVFWAFAAGLVSFLSPCVLPLVPGYVSYVAGRSLGDLVEDDTAAHRLSAIALSVFFVLGFSVIFIALGAGASVVGQFLRTFLFEAGYVAGGLIVLFGLHMMGVLRFGWLSREWRFAGPIAGGRPAGAFLLGMAFAFGWTPCIGPILGTILTMGAATTQVAEGMVLLSVYSLGLAVPFLLVAAFTGWSVGASRELRRIGRPLQTVAGGGMVLAGVAMATGSLNSVGTWLLATFPVFQGILL